MSLTVVTGAGGFVGGVLVPMLVAQGRQVRAVDLRRGPALAGQDVDFVEADITDPAALAGALEGAETVFHLVARISITGDPDGSVQAINVEGARNVARAAREAGVRRYVHCSSIHAFDLDAVGPITETSPRSTRPELPAYDRSKYAGEQAVRDQIDEGLDAVLINPSGIIGPHDHAPSRMGHVFLALFGGRSPANVAGAFDWVDVRDVAAGAIAAEAHGRTGENYLLAGHRATIKEIAEISAEVAGVAAPRLTLPMWLARLAAPTAEWQARRTDAPPLFTREALHALQSDPDVRATKAAEELGYQPRAFRETIADTFAWFSDQGLLEDPPN